MIICLSVLIFSFRIAVIEWNLTENAKVTNGKLKKKL